MQHRSLVVPRTVRRAVGCACLTGAACVPSALAAQGDGLPDRHDLATTAQPAQCNGDVIRDITVHASAPTVAGVTRDYLLRRPLLQAIEHPGPRPAVLLLDEIDRADAEFEAFTFEVLAEAAVTVPELGTIRAAHPPVVVLTSNRTRDLHDALKRRCLYHWVEHPDLAREVARDPQLSSVPVVVLTGDKVLSFTSPARASELPNTS